MKFNFETLKNLFLLKAKFAMTGLVATGVDFAVYSLLVKYYHFSSVTAHAISYSIGTVLNFLMHKRFVFTLEGSVSRAFLLSVAISVGGLTLGTGIMYILSQIDFFSTRPIIAKICTTGIIFFYNFYLKRYVFERKFI